MSSKVIGIASLPGAGKSELATEMSKLGVEHFNGGQVLRSTAHTNGFVPKDMMRDAYAPFWNEYSREHGRDWLAQLAILSAEKHNRPVVMDGVRIPEDARTIAAGGNLYWFHGNLSVMANRVINRARVDDVNTFATENQYIEIMKKDLANQGTFPMGEIRDMCESFLLPIPEINDTTERSQKYHALAVNILQVSGIEITVPN